MTKINPSGGSNEARKKAAMMGAAGAVSLLLLVLADSTLELGVVDEFLSVAGLSEAPQDPAADAPADPAAQGAVASEASGAPAAPGTKLKAKKGKGTPLAADADGASESNAAREAGGEEGDVEDDGDDTASSLPPAAAASSGAGAPSAAAPGAGRAPPLKANAPEADEQVGDALANIASWEAADGAYPEGSLLGYLQHKKAWVSLSALAFAVETNVYSRAFLQARAEEIVSRSKPAQLRRFVKRYRKAKPAVYAELNALIALRPKLEPTGVPTPAVPPGTKPKGAR